MLSNRQSADIDAENPVLRTRTTINPYLRAAEMIYRRLLWDMHLESWRSRRRVKSWMNRYMGRKAVIICNGPSLLKSDLSVLDGVFCFGLNKINLLFDNSNFRPDCVVAVNRFVIEQNAGFYNTTELPLFLDSVGFTRNLVRKRKNVCFLYSGPDGFARDCSMGISQGYTVTYVALQLAFHMGFRDVALIGADHNFAEKGEPNKTVVSGEKDESHFDPRYFSGGVNWQLPDLVESEASYARAKRIFEASGGRILNATEGGNLEVFNRVSLEEFVAS